MTSQRQRKAGFELPDPITGWPLIDVCLKIPDAPQYRRAFLGHIYKLGLWAAWEKSYLPSDTRAKEAGELWRETLNQYLMMGDECMGGCCNDPPPIYRYNDNGDLEQSTDGGEVWTPAPGFDARYNSPQFPPMAGDDGDDKKCLAATGAALLMKQQVADQLTDDMARYTLAQLLSDWTKTVMDSGGNIFQALLTIAANQTFSLGIAALRAALTDDVWEIVKCAIYCHMEDDASFTDSDWRAVMDEMGSMLGGVAKSFLIHLVDLLGPVGLTNLSRSGGAAEGDCDTCHCDETWCKTFDFTVESFDALWSSYNPSSNPAVFNTHYVASTGWQTANGSPNYSIIKIQMNTHVLTRVTFTLDPSTDSTAFMGILPSSTADELVNYAVNDRFFDGSEPTGTYLAIGQRDRAMLTHVTLEGTGVNPFGANNC